MVMTSNQNGSKTCSRCGETKLLAEFYQYKPSPDGINAACKVCIRIYQNGRLKVRAAAHEAKHGETLAEYHRRYRSENPDKMKTIEARRDRATVAAWARTWRAKNKDRLNTAVRERRRQKRLADPAGEAAKHRAYLERHRKKVRTRKALRAAVAEGRIEKPDRCAECDTVGPVEGHHEDYDRRYDVIWLCDSCHGKLHRKY